LSRISPQNEKGREKEKVKEKEILRYYRALSRAWGAQHWWPAKSRFEVIVGAYLTQNTAWTNVEQALANLRSAESLSVEGIREIPQGRLERLIRPSGYFRQKAQRLKMFVTFLDDKHGGSLERLFSQPTGKLREELLGLNGVGPETADSILLYAGNHPVFVVDAYTRRILDRHGILPEKTDYEEIRESFEKALATAAREPEASLANAAARQAPGIRGAAHAFPTGRRPRAPCRFITPCEERACRRRRLLICARVACQARFWVRWLGLLDGWVVRGLGRGEGCGACGRPALSRSAIRVVPGRRHDG